MAGRNLQEVADRLEGLIARFETTLHEGHRCREEEYREMLQETAAVLVSTKSSFRSRQLKDLRQRIEAVLQ